MKKLDLKRELKQLYSSSRRPIIIKVPPAKFLMVTGRGEPGGGEYQTALRAGLNGNDLHTIT